MIIIDSLIRIGFKVLLILVSRFIELRVFLLSGNVFFNCLGIYVKIQRNQLAVNLKIPRIIFQKKDDLGMTQKEVANQIGLSVTMYSMFENEQVDLTSDKKEILKELFGIKEA